MVEWLDIRKSYEFQGKKCFLFWVVCSGNANKAGMKVDKAKIRLKRSYWLTWSAVQFWSGILGAVSLI